MKITNRKDGTEFIRRVLDLLEVNAWEKLPGTFLRVRASWSKVDAIGHPLKDRWFSPAELATEMGIGK